MLELLSYQSIRLLNICELLITKQSASSLDHLQALNQCSRKTVYDDLELLNRHPSQVVHLEFQQNYVYNNERSVAKLIAFKKELYHQELKLNILKSIFCYPYETVVDHSHRLNYSDSTIRKNIREMRDYLQKFGITIAANARYEYILEAENENTLRSFMKHIFQVSGFCKNQAPLYPQEKERYNHFIQKHDIILTEALDEEAKLLYYCIVQREKQGFKDPKIYDQAQRIPEQRKKLDLILDDLFQNFFEESDYDISEEDYLLLLNTLTLIGISSQSLPRHVDYHFNRYRYFYESFKQENPLFAEIIEKYIQILDEKTGLRFSLYIHEIVFHLYTHFSTRYYREIKIAVYSDLGMHHTQSLIRFMMKHFPQQIIVPYNDNEDFDLIVSTLDKNQVSTPLVTISDYPDSFDIKNIYEAIYSNYAHNFVKKEII